MSEFRPICPSEAIAPGTWQCFRVDAENVAIFNVDGQYHAISDDCPHRGGPLSQGFLEGSTVFCPLHGWPFDVKTGAMPGNPELAVATYPVKVENGFILVGPAIEPSIS